MMKTSSRQQAAQTMPEPRTETADMNPAMSTSTVHQFQNAAELPVPRVDDDDFAPTIVRGRE